MDSSNIRENTHAGSWYLGESNKSSFLKLKKKISLTINFMLISQKHRRKWKLKRSKL